MTEVALLNKAAFEGDLELLRTLLVAASASTGRSSIDRLIDHDDGGRGPLHFAILGRQEETVQVLLNEYDVSPFLLDEDAWSPLHVAASVGSVGCIDLLVEQVRLRREASAAADALVVYCNQTTTAGRHTALHLAAAKGHQMATLRLLVYGASSVLRNAQGQTPLHRAACAGQLSVVAVLLEAEPTVVNWSDATAERNTALHLAAEDGHLAVVRLLCETGQADVAVRNAAGQTPEEVSGTVDVREYLSQLRVR